MNITAPMQVLDYTIGRPIGRGNFSIVRQAKHRGLNAKVAIKIIDKSSDKVDAETLRKFYREIQIMRAMRHPHIVRLYQVFESDRAIFVVMEYANCGEVFDHIKSHGRMTERDARKYFRQIVSAVAYCHANGVVHRDLKTENLLLDSKMNIKLADFGFSTYFKPGESLKTWCGSPPYAAPELFLGEDYDGTLADVWSLGVVLYILVCGGFPFPGTSLQRLSVAVTNGRFVVPFYVSPECSDLIKRMLVVDPNARINIAQIVNHKWMRMDWSDELDSLFLRSFHPDSVPVNNDVQLHELVMTRLEDSGYDIGKVKLSLQNEAFDSEYASYQLLYDKLKRKRQSVQKSLPQQCSVQFPQAQLLAPPMSNAPRRGSITTGIVGDQAHSHDDAESIPIADALKLSQLKMADEETSTSSSEESVDEPAPEALQRYLHYRRHTLGVPEASLNPTGCNISGMTDVPPMLPFQFTFGLGSDVNPPPPTITHLPPQMFPVMMNANTLLDFGPLEAGISVGGKNAGRRCSDAVATIPDYCIPPALNVDAGNNCGVAGITDSMEIDDTMEEQAANKYLTSRGGIKRHTVAGGRISPPIREQNIMNRQHSPLPYHHRRSSVHSQPYPPIAPPQRRSSDTSTHPNPMSNALLNPSVQEHLERLYNQAVGPGSTTSLGSLQTVSGPFTGIGLPTSEPNRHSPRNMSSAQLNSIREDSHENGVNTMGNHSKISFMSITTGFSQASAQQLQSMTASDPLQSFEMFADNIVSSSAAGAGGIQEPSLGQYFCPQQSPVQQILQKQPSKAFLSKKTISALLIEIKRVLEKMKVTYVMEGGSNRIHDGEPDSQGSSRRLSLESDDGTKLEIGIAPAIEGGFSQLELRHVEGDVTKYQRLCTELITEIRL